VDSDHLLELKIAEKKKKRQEKRTGRAEEGKGMRIVWDKMAIQEFRERTEELCMIEEEEEEQESLTIENKWIRIRQIVNEAMVRKEIRRKRQVLSYKNWWNKSCTTMKRGVKRIYSRWRKGNVVRGRYMEEGKLFRKLGKKQKEKREEERKS